MDDLIIELSKLITTIRIGTTGYASLANSEKVTVYKIQLIISKLKEINNG